MNGRTILAFGVMIVVAPLTSYAGVFASTSGSVLSCASSDGEINKVDITLFPKTIRVNGTFLELQSYKDANDGFKIGKYKEAYGAANDSFAVKAGYKPVLVENSRIYICD